MFEVQSCSDRCNGTLDLEEELELPHEDVFCFLIIEMTSSFSFHPAIGACAQPLKLCSPELGNWQTPEEVGHIQWNHSGLPESVPASSHLYPLHLERT